MKILLQTREDIDRTSTLATWLSRPSVEQVAVSLPWLSERQRFETEKRLKFLFNDCGCLWAGPVFLVVFTTRFVSEMSVRGFSWPMLGFSFALGAVAALSAKFLGLGWSCTRLKAVLERVKGQDRGELQGGE